MWKWVVICCGCNPQPNQQHLNWIASIQTGEWSAMVSQLAGHNANFKPIECLWELWLFKCHMECKHSRHSSIQQFFQNFRCQYPILNQYRVAISTPFFPWSAALFVVLKTGGVFVLQNQLLLQLSSQMLSSSRQAELFLFLAEKNISSSSGPRKEKKKEEKEEEKQK